jgi:hypothetical protein
VAVENQDALNRTDSPKFAPGSFLIDVEEGKDEQKQGEGAGQDKGQGQPAFTGQAFPALVVVRMLSAR